MGILRFGSNGWRARIDDGFDRTNVLRMACALAEAWSCRNGAGTIMVGFDGRRYSSRLAIGLGKVIASSGLRVLVATNPCPTPALAWHVAQDPTCVGGVMVTAAEAPCEYGGLLVCGADGGPESEAFIERVETLARHAMSGDEGAIERFDMNSSYADTLVWQVDAGLIASGDLHVVIDPLYATGAHLASSVLSRVGCTVTAVHDELVSDFRGLHPQAKEPWVDECERAVVKAGADLGLVLDGDCSNMALVDETGMLVSPHDLAPLVLEHLVMQRGMQGRVVATVSTSARIRLQAERLGCPFTMVPVGAEYLHRELIDGDMLLAVDERGGLCVPNHVAKRDALFTALNIVELVAGASESVHEHVARLEQDLGQREYGSRDVWLDFAAMQRLRNLLPGTNPQEILGMRPVRVSHADGLYLQFEDDSWLLVRPSRTRLVARCVAEAPDSLRLRRLLEEGARLARDLS